ncbi:hypothetical protein B0H17DRAFT_1195153 [Mycena rosella]|uniref:Uncharacterized protein n=1 Tax=Mycena rosella TaxID=1033263 RepID=A0AAD7GMR9_MYCRO|nr:hypothetical protein B0H17DRAFT_1195153 [Mycena rosella]
MNARKSRWEEEVDLLREEMRRVIRYLEWQVTRWEEWRMATATCVDIDAGMHHGMAVYAAKQATFHHKICAHFRAGLSLSVDDATSSVISTIEGEDLNAFLILHTWREAGGWA